MHNNIIIKKCAECNTETQILISEDLEDFGVEIDNDDFICPECWLKIRDENISKTPISKLNLGVPQDNENTKKNN
jgi:hypothetical protein